MPPRDPNRVKLLTVVFFLIISTLISYSPVIENEFLNYDDNGYITENKHVKSGLSIETLIWAFQSTEQANWHPLTWISHALDCTMFGLDPKYHHAMNLFIHILSSIILFLLLNKITHSLWGSAFVAIVFAIHPLHVESVAWASERKDVLSGLLFFLTLSAYTSYKQSQNKTLYFLTIVLFTLGLLAKPMLVTLPFVLILLDYWLLPPFSNQNKPFKKTNKRELDFLIKSFIGKIPFFILSLASSIVTYIVQRAGGSTVGGESIDLNDRIANAIISYGKYIWKTFYPIDLAIFYPHPGSNWVFWEFLFSLFMILLISFFIWKLRKSHPFLPVGWFWFLGMLVPVIGLVQVGLQSMADRYMYIPMVGFTIVIAWGIPKIMTKLHWRQYVLGALSILVIISMILLTRSQVKIWKDNFTLFGHALSVTSNNYVAHNGIGVAHADFGRNLDAISHFKEGVRIRPDDFLIRSNLVGMLAQQQKYREAIEHCMLLLHYYPTNPSSYERAAEIYEYEKNYKEAVKFYILAAKFDSTNSRTFCRLGKLYGIGGEYEIAKQYCFKALQLNPRSSEAYNILGIIESNLNNYEGAVQNFSKAIEYDSLNANAYSDFGLLYEQSGKPNEAIAMYSRAVKIDSNHENANINLGTILAGEGKLNEAEIYFRNAAKIHPKSLDARIGLGKIYTIKKQFEDAIQQLTKGIDIDSNSAVTHYHLAAVFMEMNKFKEAENHYRVAVQLAPNFTEAQTALEKVRNRLKY